MAAIAAQERVTAEGRDRGVMHRIADLILSNLKLPVSCRC